jgi:hypothetical protein
MTYVQQTWTPNVTPVDAAHMNHIEAGIAAVEAEIPSIPAVVNGQWIKGVGGAAVWSAITPADVANIPYGTSLPASPFNGQEAILVDSTTNPSYAWRFRYNAGSTSTYKWEFIGGAPSLAYEAVDFVISTPTPAGPVLTAPRAGQYVLQHSSFGYSPDSVGSYFYGIFVPYPSGSALSGGDTPNVGFPVLNLAVELFHEYIYTVPTAAQGLAFQITPGPGTVHSRQRSSSILPVRVS